MCAKQIKVCQVLHGIVGGGSEQVVLNYCSRMSDIHFDLLYQYEPNPQILERFNEAGINCIQIPDKLHHPIKHLWSIFRIFRNGHYDVVHSHLDWFLNAYVMFLAWLARIPKRIAHHHQAYGCHSGHRAGISFKTLLFALLRIPNKMFATHWLACGKAAAENGWGRAAVAKGKVTILPNAIDPERFKFDAVARKQIRGQYGIAEDDFVVGHVGRFFPEKNHRFIIELFAELQKKNPKAKLLLVGNGPLQDDVKTLVHEKSLDDSVIFAGLQKDTVPFYCAFDVLLLPSVREAFPMTLVEAQYNGLQCVVSDAVPNEVAISSRVKKFPIKEVQPWVAELVKKNTRVENVDCRVDNDRFDIRKCYELLELIYRS
ncbi:MULTISPECIES: glycosyltransferase [unclassified Fibrobacter]|uniref:glycosyltransferase n=1 Tax=unclassified Fibrobacter TaxID=2634177 RepID=UPI0009223119|nr:MULTISPECIES: glycosyltransferase [unclassified Fibrobacter]SHL88256.1 Glycosyltransferase involved in cell wall bisynthesis [Fibrobacter sp. UWH6]